MVGACRALGFRARVSLLFEYNLPRLLSADFVRALGARPMSPVIVRDGAKVAPPSIQVNVETTRVFPKRVFNAKKTRRGGRVSYSVVHLCTRNLDVCFAFFQGWRFSGWFDKRNFAPEGVTLGKGRCIFIRVENLLRPIDVVAECGGHVLQSVGRSYARCGCDYKRHAVCVCV